MTIEGPVSESGSNPFCWTQAGRGIAAVLCLVVVLLVSGAMVVTPAARADTGDITKSYGLATDAMKAGDYESAVDHMAKALSLAEAASERDDAQIGVLAYNLGQLQMELDRFAAARSSLETAVESYSATYGKKSPKGVAPLEKLGACLDRLGEYRDAYRAYDRIVDIQEKEFGQDSVEVAIALGPVARAASDAENFRKSSRSFKRALRIWKKERGPRSAEVGQVSLFLGLSELSLGEMSLAIHHIEEGYEILEEALPDGHPDKIQMYTFLEGFAKQSQGIPGAPSTDLPDLQALQEKLAANRTAARSAVQGAEADNE